jgi:hypothetical protein
VLLQSLKSAAAGLLHRHITATAATGNRPEIRRTEGEGKWRESFAVMRRGYIKSLKISRYPAGPVDGREAPFPRHGNRGPPTLRADMAKSVTIAT